MSAPVPPPLPSARSGERSGAAPDHLGPHSAQSTTIEAWLRDHLIGLLDRVSLGIFCAGQGLRLDHVASPLLPMGELVPALIAHLSTHVSLRRFAAALLADEEVGPRARALGLGVLLGELPPRTGPRSPQISHRLPRVSAFAGRAEQLSTLDWAWQEGARVMAVCAPPGCGKTALVQHWLDGRGLSDPRRWRDFGVEGLFVWSFAADPDVAGFLRAAADYVEGRPPVSSPLDEGAPLPEDVSRRRDLRRLLQGLSRLRGHVLIILDGLERFQTGPGGDAPVPMVGAQDDAYRPGEITDPDLRSLLIELSAVDGESALLCTLEREVPSLQPWRGSGYISVRVPPLPLADGVKMLRQLGVARGGDADAERRCAEHGGHALTLDLLGRYLRTYYRGDARAVTVSELPPSEHARLPEAPTLRRVLRAQVQALTESQRGLLDVCVLLPGPVPLSSLSSLAQAAQEHGAQGLAVEGLLQPLRGLDAAALQVRLSELAALGLVHLHADPEGAVVDVHPLLRRLLYQGWLAQRGGRAATAVESLRGGDPLPRTQDTAVLDLLEQLVLASLQAGLIGEAYHLVTARMGGYPHLGRDLGEYRRLVTVLRILSPVLLTVAEGNPTWALRSVRVAAWEAAALRDLGQLGESLGASGRAVSGRTGPVLAARAWQAESYLLSGRLRQAAAAASDAFYGARTAVSRVAAAVQQARVLLLLGEVALSRVHLMEAALTLREQPEAICEWTGRSMREILNLEQAHLLLRLSDIEQVRALVGRCHAVAMRDGRGKDLALLDILTGELARRERDALEAAQAVHRALSWGSRSGDAEVLVRAGLCHARLRMDAGNLDGAASALGMALPAALEMGMDLDRIDLLLLRGYLLLRRGDTAGAENDARDALAYAMAPECGYLWGEADALHLLSLVLLCGRRSGVIRVKEAAAHLADELELRERMQDPKAEDVRWLLQRVIN